MSAAKITASFRSTTWTSATGPPRGALMPQPNRCTDEYSNYSRFVRRRRCSSRSLDRNLGLGRTLTRLAPLATLSPSAGEGLHNALSSKLLSRSAGEEGPSPTGLVGEGSAASSSCDHPRPLLRSFLRGLRTLRGDIHKQWRERITVM